jgi:hypothetical protein
VTAQLGEMQEKKTERASNENSDSDKTLQGGRVRKYRLDPD